MSESDNPRPNHVKYHARNVAMRKSAANIRMGPEARIRLTRGGSLVSVSAIGLKDNNVDMLQLVVMQPIEYTIFNASLFTSGSVGCVTTS